MIDELDLAFDEGPEIRTLDDHRLTTSYEDSVRGAQRLYERRRVSDRVIERV